MSARLSCLFVLALLLITANGCQKVGLDKKITLTPGEPMEFSITAPTYQQKVTVTITPESAGVSAYLVKEADAPAVKKALDSNKEPAAELLLGSRIGKKEAESYTFDATVPAKTPYVLLLQAVGKPTGATVKLVGR